MYDSGMSQTIQKARRLAIEADSSERQAESYDAIAAAISALDIDDEIKRTEIARLERFSEEFYADADDRRGQVEPELIDQL